MELPRERWIEAEPRRAEAERAAMARVAPELAWREDLSHGGRDDLSGWEGVAPVWAAARPKPAGVDELLGDRRLRLQVVYSEAFPMVPPAVIPVEPGVPLVRRTQHTWHVNGDGSLCLMQAATDWHPKETGADLVAKACGWFIEYRLMEENRIEQMTLRGIYDNEDLDELIGTFAA